MYSTLSAKKVAQISVLLHKSKDKKMIRFSKENFLNALENQISKMEDMWGFVTTNGTNQIKDKTDFDRVMAYGEYISLLDIYESVRDNTFLN